MKNDAGKKQGRKKHYGLPDVRYRVYGIAKNCDPCISQNADGYINVEKHIFTPCVK